MKTSRRVVDRVVRIVLAGILCLLLYVVVNDGGHPSPRARFAETQAQINSFATALDAFKVDNGFYPSSTNGLEALIQQPPNAPNWRGPYLMSETVIPADPWGSQYHYIVPGLHNTNSFDILSAGPDRRFGTEDDIVNWVVVTH